MTVAYLGAGIHVGTSSDTKPTNVPENSLFIETNTLTLWILLSGVWKVFPGGLDAYTALNTATFDEAPEEFTSNITGSFSETPEDEITCNATATFSE